MLCRRGECPRCPGDARRCRGSCCGSVPPQRLVGTRRSGVGIVAAGALSGQELRDHHFTVGGNARRAGAVPLSVVSSSRRGSAAASVSGVSGERAIRRSGPDARGARALLTDARVRHGAPAPQSQPVPGHVLDDWADGDTSREQRVQSHAGRSARQRDRLRVGYGRTGMSARDHVPGQSHGAASDGRGAHVSAGWRRSVVHRLLRTSRCHTYRLRNVPGDDRFRRGTDQWPVYSVTVQPELRRLSAMTA